MPLLSACFCTAYDRVLVTTDPETDDLVAIWAYVDHLQREEEAPKELRFLVGEGEALFHLCAESLGY